MINIGRYIHRVEFLIATHQKDEFKAVQTTWVPLFTRRARVITKSTKTTTDITPSTQIELEIRVRFHPDITAELQVKFNNQLYIIDSVIDYDNSGSELQIKAIKQ
ncbi:phage head closure protein [Shewanella frigidimarina]|uniref:phage head closure protein n=1 Tax=Shewanella frigidimarina TaxID=56812 RepID=UPI003D7A6812